jgi:putative CocE/NonD family hydrolase
MVDSAHAEIVVAEQKTATAASTKLMRVRKHALMLCVLLFLFCLRVLGQLLVANFHVSFLPPMDDWFSGLMPYPPLLVCQAIIIILFAKICLDIYSNSGWFAKSHPRLGSFLCSFGPLYFFTMILRYIINMSLYSHERWLGGTIPIIFHCVLATFLIVLGDFYSSFGKRKQRTSALSLRRLTIASLIFAGLSLWSVWQLLPSLTAHYLCLRGSEYAVRLQRNVPLVLPDGVTLKADIFHPQHTHKTPTILVRIPFSKSFKNDFLENLMGRIWSERGYTVVVQGTRGRAGSGGIFYPLRDDSEDGRLTLKWIAEQPWFNGQIVTWGGSASGHSQFAISNATDPALSAMCVYEASTNFHEMFYPGGAFSLYSAVAWMINSQGKTDLPDWPTRETIVQACEGLPASNADLRSVNREVEFFRDWTQHSKNDKYWLKIDGENESSRLQAPALLMAGWYDPFLPSQLKDWDALHHTKSCFVGSHSRLIIGPWAHGREATLVDGTKPENFRLVSFTEGLRFFDQILGVSHACQADAPVKIFVMGKNQWRDEHEWPLLRTKYTDLYLCHTNKYPTRVERRLSFDMPQIERNIRPENCDYFTYDPQNPVPTHGGAMIGQPNAVDLQNEIEARHDVLTYTSANLTSDLEITGPLRAILYVQTSAQNTDFTIKLVDVFPDGRAFNVSDGIIRRSFSTNKPEKIEIELWPTSTSFLKGHRLRVEISSSNFPRYGVNPNTGENPATAIKTRVAHQTIFSGAFYPSRIIIPVIPQSN